MPDKNLIDNAEKMQDICGQIILQSALFIEKTASAQKDKNGKASEKETEQIIQTYLVPLLGTIHQDLLPVWQASKGMPATESQKTQSRFEINEN